MPEKFCGGAHVGCEVQGFAKLTIGYHGALECAGAAD
jgi:hypothetical protein